MSPGPNARTVSVPLFAAKPPPLSRRWLLAIGVLN
jgi:hypothetical protein